MLVASDANWAMSMQAFNRGQPGLGLLLGGGFALWSFWVLGTWLGIYFGNAVSDPKNLGLDMVMGCFLLAMAVGGGKTYACWSSGPSQPSHRCWRTGTYRKTATSL
ncbi:hypothetical protein [Thalassolituus maritimus]|uniref:Uncharacterized protein n=1 Tax=Thalassolituus maritimus TaxID=484498 RepID=A0ABP9ZYW5_9GAMM